MFPFNILTQSTQRRSFSDHHLLRRVCHSLLRSSINGHLDSHLLCRIERERGRRHFHVQVVSEQLLGSEYQLNNRKEQSKTISRVLNSNVSIASLFFNSNSEAVISQWGNFRWKDDLIQSHGGKVLCTIE